MKRYSLRVPDALYAAWREVYSQTYPTHRLSFHAWILATLSASVTESGPEPKSN